MAQVEPDPARPRLAHVGIDAPLGIDDGKLAGEDVGVDVARAELLQDQVRIGPLRRPGPNRLSPACHGRPASTARSTDAHGGCSASEGSLVQ